MPIVKIGTTKCPQVIHVQYLHGQRNDIFCPQTAEVFQIISGSSYKSVCSGVDLETGDDTGVHHTHFFGAYYLENVIPL